MVLSTLGCHVVLAYVMISATLIYNHCYLQALTAKQAQRKLEEQKQHAAKVTATAGQRVQEAVAAEAARLKQLEDSRVHLMLCIIRDTSAAAPTGKHVSTLLLLRR